MPPGQKPVISQKGFSGDSFYNTNKNDYIIGHIHNERHVCDCVTNQSPSTEISSEIGMKYDQ